MKQELLNITNKVTRPFGLGDLVAFLVHPVALMAAMTDCKKCRARRKKLNSLYPNINPLTIIRLIVDVTAA